MKKKKLNTHTHKRNHQKLKAAVDEENKDQFTCEDDTRPEEREKHKALGCLNCKGVSTGSPPSHVGKEMSVSQKVT